jgi:single-strand DNA-binding protein
MQKNKVELMGFLAADAVIRTGKNDKQFTTLRLGTTRSRKDKETGEYVSQPTQWHNLIVFGKLGEFAAKLKKGAHIEVEGELQYAEYKGVQTASIRVNSILKLDRAEKAAQEDQDAEMEAGGGMPFENAAE